jgi:uncharacterized protein (DUF2147 family)
MSLLLATLALATQVMPAQSATPAGRWVNPSRSVILLVAPCGKKLCGTVQWASDKAKDDAKWGADPLVGAELLSGVKEVHGGRWQGKLFLPDLNQRVTARLEPLDGRQLKVSYCAMGGALCRKQIWTRTP